MAIKDQKTKSLISYYEVLNVSPTADDQEIKCAFRSMAKRYHPDNNPQNTRIAELRFKLINDAYTHISSHEKRARYNTMLRRRTLARNDNQSGAAPQSSSWFSNITKMFSTPKTSSRKI